MAVDEFGREIPAPTTGAGSTSGAGGGAYYGPASSSSSTAQPAPPPPPPPPPAPSGSAGAGGERPPRHYHQDGGGGGGGAYHSHGHYNNNYSSSGQHHYRGGGGGGGRYGGGPPPPYGGGPCEGGGAGGPRFGQPPQPPYPGGPNTAGLPPPPSSIAGGGAAAGAATATNRRKQHPSFTYVDEPLLCQYVWKDQQQEKEATDAKKQDTVKEEDAATTNDNDDAAPEATASTTETGYQDYKQQYCLNYVRAFFNHHLDDSWFRARFSPAARKKIALQDVKRAVQEAATIQEEIQQQQDEGNNNNKSGPQHAWVKNCALGGGLKPQSSSSTSGVLGSGLSSPRFATGQQQQQQQYQAIPPSHLLSLQRQMLLHVTDIPPHVTDEQIQQALLDHYHEATAGASPSNAGREGSRSSAATSQKVDLQVYAVQPVASPTTVGRTVLYRSLLVVGEAATLSKIHKHLQQQQQSRRRGGVSGGNHPEDPAAGSGSGGAVVVPRKGGDEEDGGGLDEGDLDLTVNCSDPYGRQEYDADGKGGAPSDGLAVPVKRAVVLVRKVPPYNSNSHNNSNKPGYNQPLHHQQHPARFGFSSNVTAPPTIVLSAALSSRKRISKDKQAACTIARALDLKMQIPTGHRLDDLLQDLFGDDDDDDDDDEEENEHDEENESGKRQQNAKPTTDECILDVALAYLRRVHLFHFYNGCTQTPSVGDVLLGKHCTVYLRLQNADEILDAAANKNSNNVTVKTEGDVGGSEQLGENKNNSNTKKEDDDDDEGDDNDATFLGVPKQEEQQQQQPKDMLVQRLDDAIAKTLQECQVWMSEAGTAVGSPLWVNAASDAQATRIEEMEREAEERWLEDHSILDDDGRARCSFHFCHKLFKDSTFLHKHLLKKHVEFLRAEQAKCHDEAMMEAWDACESRPVPDVLVDCGMQFGWVAAAVTGRVPDCVDPEPELWRREEERRKLEQEQMERRREERMAREKEAAAVQKEHRAATFVDVDDMKEEKVELSFDNIDVPATGDGAAAATTGIDATTGAKKKRKKRKLL